MTEPALEKYFLFDVNDLEANRSGVLTAKQQQYLTEDVKYTKMAGWGCSAVFFIAAIVIVVLQLVNMLTAEHGFDSTSLRSLLPSLGLAAVVALMGVMTAVWTLSKSGAKAQAQLKRAEGPIAIAAVQRQVEAHSSPYTAHELHVGGAVFDVKADITSVLQPGERYVVYYTESPQGTERLIQSVERLPAG